MPEPPTLTPPAPGPGPAPGCAVPDPLADLAGDLFQQFWEAAPDAMLLIDQAGCIVLVNAPAERLFGYPRAELLGQPLDRLLPERLRARHRAHLAAYFRQPHARPMGAGVELPACRRDGAEFPAEISLSPVLTRRGVLVFTSIRDITQRKVAEESLRETRARLLAAQRIQQRLLPQAPPSLPGLDLAGACHPAAFAAGDHYDYLTLADGSLGLVVADVAGHGFDAALLMATTHAHLRSLAETHSSLELIAARANGRLCDETDDCRFVTLFLAQLDLPARQLRYLSAGHPAGYLLDAAGALKALLPSTAIPLGVLPDARFAPGPPVALAAGDLLLLLTDGLLEARSPSGEQFGAQRVLDFVRARRAAPAAALIAGLHAAVLDFSAHAHPLDDVTALAVHVLSLP